MTVAAVALLALGILLTLLPLIPALVEWRLKRDAEPLQVVRRQDTNIRHFAESFARFAAATLERHGVDCRGDHPGLQGVTDKGEPFVFLGPGDTLSLSPRERRAGEVDRLVFACGQRHLPGDRVYRRGIGGRDLVLGRRAICHSVLAEGSLILEDECVIARWLHAHGPLRVGPNCRLYSRASCDSLMTLAVGVHFERVNAPVIRCGPPRDSVTPRPDFARNRQPWLPPEPRVHLDAGTVLVERRRLEVPAGVRVPASLVSRGTLTLARDTLVTGALKARGALVLGERCIVRGALVSAGRVHIRAGCVVTGPIVAEREVVIEAGTVVGAAHLRTTITAPRVTLCSGVRVSGSVWARDGADVTAGLDG